MRARAVPGGIDVDELAERYVERRMSLEGFLPARGVQFYDPDP